MDIKKLPAYRYDEILPEDSALLRELLKETEIEQVFESYFNLTAIPVAILDLDANVLFSSSWQRICTQYHRNHPTTCGRCIESDTQLALQRVGGKNHSIYTCRNGLTDCAAPIIIEGKHIANCFIGQFFIKKPDEAVFRRQAEEFGFDVADYIAALHEVPVVEEEKIPVLLDLLARMTRLITNLSIGRKRAIESQTRQSLILNAIPQAVFWKDTEGRYLGCNTAFARSVGLETPDEIVGRTDFDLPWAREKAEAYRADDLAVISANKPRRHIIESLQQANGSRLMVATSKIPLVDAGNTLYGVVGIYEDITRRKQQEDQLREDEKKLRAMFNEAGYAIGVAKAGMTYMVNTAYLELFGFDDDSELIGKSLIEQIAPSERSRISKMSVDRSEGKPVPEFYETKGLRKDGTVFDMNVRISTYEYMGEVYTVGILRDISDRKKSENLMRASEDKYRALFENAGDAIFIADAGTGTILEANMMAEKLLDRPRHEIIGMNRSLLHPSTGEYNGQFAAHVDSGQVSDQESVVVDRSGRLIPVRISAMVMEIGGKRVMQGIFRDITERKRSEKMLHEAVTKLKLTIDDAPIGIIMVDLTAFPNMRILSSNKAFCDFLGYCEEELKQKTIRDITFPDDLDVGKTEVHAIFSGKMKSAPIQKRYVRKDGVAVWAEVNIYLIRDTNNQPLNTLAVIQDITERKRAEDDLRESESRYHALFTGITDAIYVHHITKDGGPGEIIDVNDVACKMLGYTREALIGMRIGDIDAPESTVDVHRVVEAIKNGRDVLFEQVHVTKTGRRIHVEVHAQTYDYKGRRAIFSTVRDITDRKRVEAELKARETRLASIFRAAPAAIVFIRNRTIIEANDRFFQLLGYTQEELLGENTEIIYPTQEDFQRVGRELYARLAEKEVVVMEYPLRHKDGAIVNTLTSASFLDPDNPGGGLVAFILDITERIKLEEQLRQAQKMESVGRLAGGVAHDFNNMLSVILGNIELAHDDLESRKPLYHHLEEIRSAALRSADLTRQLLAFSRRQAIEPRPLNLNHIIGDMLKMLHRLLGEDINLAWLPEKSLWRVNMDPAQVDQILANLCINARDAISGQGKITIETHNCAFDGDCFDEDSFISPGRYVMLSVRDNGSGMDEKTQSLIFEPFFTTKKDGRGTGLGLATVYGIVKQNNGFIHVHSKLGKGTTFQIYLPLYEAQEEADRIEGYTLKLRGGSETILLVEDEVMILEMCRKMLESLGYRLLCASTPKQAISMAQNYEGSIDLLITDVVMPEMNGNELAKQLGTSQPGLKTLYLSGHTADVIARHGVLKKGIQFLHKPFSKKDLALKIREILAQ